MPCLTLSHRVCIILATIQLFSYCNGFLSIRPNTALPSWVQSLKSDNTSIDIQPKKLSRPERKALERQKKEQKSANRRRSQARAKYNLHSNAVSELTPKSGPEDVLRAIKRAQNLHDHHDVRVIANFLMDECGENFAYGYRGSLLARLAVAALHFGNHEVARRAITVRRLKHRPSMLPMESAAVIRGLLRSKNTTEAMDLLYDELKLPLEVSFVFH